MQDKFSMTILVEPVAKGRPQVTMVKGKPLVYTPDKTRKAEAEIRTAIAQKILGELSRLMFEPYIPIAIEATFFLLRPKAKPKRFTMPTTKPDYDNLAKMLTDALEKFCFYSDSQITTAIIKKRYGMPARIELTLGIDSLEGG